MRKTHHGKGKLFVISGPSGAGKGTICQEVVRTCDIDLSISMTTRKPRGTEADGKEYFFVSREEFKKNIDNGNLLEYATVYDNMYGTPKDAVMKRLDRRRNVILEIDIQGGLQVKKTMPETVLIFILPPSREALKQRITGRNTDSEESMKKRLNESLNEIKLIGEYDYYVINDDLEATVEDVRSIIAAEMLKVPDKVKPIIREYEEGKQL